MTRARPLWIAGLVMCASGFGAQKTADRILDLVRQHDYDGLTRLYAAEPPADDGRAPSAEHVRAMREVLDAAKAQLRRRVAARVALEGTHLPKRVYTIQAFDGETLSLRLEDRAPQVSARALSARTLQALALQHRGKAADWCVRYGWFLLWHDEPSAARRWSLLAKAGGQDVARLDELIEAHTKADRPRAVAAPDKPQPEAAPAQATKARTSTKTPRGRRREDEQLAAVRERWKDVNAKVGTNLVEHVSEHFVVYTDLPDGKGMARGCEVVFKGLRRVFGLKKREQVWDGKCVMFLFRSRGDFLRFAEVIDAFEGAKTSGGYFKPSKHGAHIAIPQPSLMAGGDRQMVAVAVHELGHAFLETYCGHRRAPIWLHEGVAQVCEQIHDPNDRGLSRHKERMKRWVDSGYPPRTFRSMLELESMPGSDHESYAMAYSMVEWMARAEPKKLRNLLELTKRGAAPTAALEAAFDMRVTKLERYWFAYVKRAY